MEILFLEPQFKERIWGGRRIETVLNYKLPDGVIGEAWVMSGHPHGQTKIINGPYKNHFLGDLYLSHKGLFNDDPSAVFPLLIKILDANQNLSIQVHPNDDYANKVGHPYGKTECWYVLDASDDTTIIDGHLAINKDEFIDKINHNDLSLWHYKALKKGDFISIPAGKAHAIGSGAIIYEVQQSSDLTYRIYDYDRKDNSGNKRELHLKEALDVTLIPDPIVEPHIDVERINHTTVFTYLKNEYFQVQRMEVNQSYQFQTDKYLLISILNGSGMINGQQVKQNDHLVVCDIHKLEDMTITGDMELMVTQRVL